MSASEASCRRICEVFRELRLPGVALAVNPADGLLPRLMPEERVDLGQVGEARYRDFAAGRACARAALRSIAVPAVAIRIDASGGPAWPPRVVGSISHAGGIAVAAVAAQPRYSGLGIDLETTNRIGDPGAAMVLQPSEVALLPNDQTRFDLATVYFVCKEASFKAISRLTADHRFRPKDYAVDLNMRERMFRTFVTLAHQSVSIKVKGAVIQEPSLILALAWVEPEEE